MSESSRSVAAPPAVDAPAGARLTWKTVVVWVAGAVAFGLFLSRSGVADALPLLRRLTPPTVALVLVLSAAIPLLKVLRWHQLLAACGVEAPRAKLYVPVSAGFFWGLVTPGTSGEMTRGFLLGISRRVGLATVLFEKLYDSLALAGLAVAALCARLTYARSGSHLLEWLVAAAVLAAFLGLPCVAAQRVPLASDGPPMPGLRGRIVGLLGATGGLARSPRIAALSAATSCAMWLLTGAQFVLLVRLLGAPAFPWTGMGLGFFVPYIAGIVSLVPLGLGVLELTVSTLLAHYYGVGAPTAHATALAFRLVVTLPFVLWGFACYSWQAAQARRRRG